MIELYCWPTPNGHKASIMLEEVGVKYGDPGDATRAAFFGDSQYNRS